MILLGLRKPGQVSCCGFGFNVLEFEMFCLLKVFFIFYFFYGNAGKTLAFGIPAINQVLNKRNGKFSRGRYPLCLVLAPTRELAQQVCFS